MTEELVIEGFAEGSRWKGECVGGADWPDLASVLTEYPVVVEDLLNEHAHCLDVQVDVESVHVQVHVPLPLLRADRALDRRYDVA